MESTPPHAVACPRCGTPLDSSLTGGMCPKCIGRMVMEVGSSGDEDVPTEDHHTGLRIGGYELRTELGRGAMGVVYDAWQPGLKRAVALKLILAGEFASASERARFTTEAASAARLDHPNLVPIYDVGNHQGRQYYTMKRIEGQSLAARLAAGLVFSPQEAARLTATLANAVHHAHVRGLLHRDLKPANILLDAQGQPHITDFGLARQIDRDGGLTVSGTPLGTPSYMAPEIARGESSITVAVDVWSLGAILHELLTGSPPFTAGNLPDLLRKISEQELSSLSRTTPSGNRPGVGAPHEIPRDLATICLKCLRQSPSNRYASASDLAADLNRWLLNEPIEARSIGLAERSWLFCRRRPLISLLTALLLLGSIAGTSLLWRSNRQLTAALADTRAAEATARKHLHAALLSQIRLRRSTLVHSISNESLALLAEAARINPSLETRNEAILQLAVHSLSTPTNQHFHPRVFRKLDPPSKPTKQACTLDLNPDGRLLLMGAHNGFTLWDTLSGQEVWTLKQSGLPWMTAFFSPDGSELWTSAREFGIQRRSFSSITNANGTLAISVGIPEPVSDLPDPTLQLVLPNGRDWLVALNRRPLYIHRAEVWPDGDPTRARVLADGKPMTWMHCTGDARWAVSVTFPSSGIRIWNGSNAQTERLLELPGALGAAFSPDHRYLITRDAARYRAWKVGSWNPLMDWPAENTSIAGRIKFPRSGGTVYLTQGANKIQIRRLPDFSEIASLEAPLQLDMYDFVIRPDEKRIYFMGSIGDVYEWDLAQLDRELTHLGLP